MFHLGKHKFVGDYVAFHTGYKSRNHLIVRFQALESLELLLCEKLVSKTR